MFVFFFELRGRPKKKKLTALDTKTGMFCEIFGFLNLFGALFPIALAFLRKLPVIGPFLNLPIVATAADVVAGKQPESMV